MQKEVLQEGDAGDHARRSVIRKGYLYLLLFLTVIGCMVAAGFILYRVFTTLFEGAEPDFGLSLSRNIVTFLLTLVWLVYHFLTQRNDNKVAQRAIAERYASFPVLVLQDAGIDLASPIEAAFKRHAPEIPLKVHTDTEKPPEESEMEVQAIILPALHAVQPSESLRKWLDTFKGNCIFVPLPVDQWVWLDTGAQKLDDLANMAVKSVTMLAEGQRVDKTTKINPWAIVGYIAGGIIVSFSIFGFLMEMFFD